MHNKQDVKSAESQDVIGYPHNVSPIKKGNYFDFQLQTKDRLMRTVCFQQSKRSLFAEYASKDVPLKIKKFRLDTSANSEDIIIDNDSMVLKLEQVEFNKEAIPDTITISIINTIAIGQLVSLKAKVVHLGETDHVKSQDLTFREAIIADPTGSIKLIVWEQFCNEITQGQTYFFKDLRIKKNTSSNEVYINTAKTGTQITVTEGFTEKLPLTIKEDYLNTTKTGEIVAVDKISAYVACSKCFKKIDLTSATNIIRCKNCNRTCKRSVCPKQWYAHIVFQTIENEEFNVTLFNHHFRQLFTQSSVVADLDNEDESTVCNKFFELPQVKLRFNKKSKVVNNVILTPTSLM